MSAALPAHVAPQGVEAPSLELLASLINEATQEHVLAGRRSLEAARRAGIYLLHAKTMIPHGKFIDFYRNKCGLLESSVSRYTRIATKYGDPAKFAIVANLTINEALKYAAGEEDAPPPPKDERQQDIFSEEAAPMPTDPASRLRAAGIPVEGGSKVGKQFRLLLQRLDRERLWERATPETLVGELDAEMLGTLAEIVPVAINWFEQLLVATRVEQAERPRLTVKQDPQRLAG